MINFFLNHPAVFYRTPQGACARIEDTIFSDNPLLARLDLRNVRIAGQRALVPLLPRWPVLLRGVRTFGRVVCGCGNCCAILGRVDVYPEVFCTPCGRSGCGGDFTFFFPCWSRAFATIEKRSGGWLYSVEFLDVNGNAIHQICLSAGSDYEAFRWWVELNHAASPVAEISPQVRSLSRLEGPTALCSGEMSLLSQKGFRALLRRLVEAEICVRIFVGNDGLEQSSDMCPSCLRDDTGWIYLGDDKCGLQLQVGRLSEICFHSSCASSSWILKAYEPEGRLVCSIAPPRGSGPKEWHASLLELEASFSNGGSA